MDSASGSMQSSSGGDEEYDSRADSISSFLNQNSPSPLSHLHAQNHRSTIFEPLSSFFDTLSTPSSSSNLNPDMVWSKNLRSELNCTDLGGLVSASTLYQQQIRPVTPSAQIPQLSPVTGLAEQVTIKNPKKRSRASRRAPTTVLTTDTSNFRAMVQEFTGIPSPPFTSSPFSRPRLDLYGTSSPALRSAAHLEVPPPQHPSYLLRPFPQKIQQSTPAFLGSSSIDAIVSATTNTYSTINTSTTSATNSSTSINYQLPQTMQNPVLNFQPLLPPPKYPLSNPQILTGKSSEPPQQQRVSSENISPVGDSHLKMLEDFGLGHGLQSMVPQQDLNESDRDHQHQQGLFMSINGNYTSSEAGGSNGKAVDVSASDFHGDEMQESVVKARSEGMMESWICSSD